VLVDGFQLGEVLKRENPDAFKFLSEVPLYFRYNEKDKINLISPNNVFELNDEGEYVQFRSALSLFSLPFIIVFET